MICPHCGKEWGNYMNLQIWQGKQDRYVEDRTCPFCWKDFKIFVQIEERNRSCEHSVVPFVDRHVGCAVNAFHWCCRKCGALFKTKEDSL